MKTFVVNGTKYNAKPFTYNVVCDLEEMGISLQEMQKKPMSIVRAYFAVCANTDLQYAGEEIEKHVLAGGDLVEVMQIMSDEMEQSDFFRAMSEQQENNTAKREETPSKAKK